MKNHQVEFHSFIGNTFETIHSGRKEEKRILFFQDWNGNVHKDALFLEIIENQAFKWKIRKSTWEMGKDTFRLLDIIENLKWIGKEIIPSIRSIEYYLSEDEKESIIRKINEVKLEVANDFNVMIYKILKLDIKGSTTNFYWNKDTEIENSILNLVKEISNKI